MVLSLRNLEETGSFYKVELEKEELTERERDKYSKALKIVEGFIEKIIKEKEDSRERRKHKKAVITKNG